MSANKIDELIYQMLEKIYSLEEDIYQAVEFQRLE